MAKQEREVVEPEVIEAFPIVRRGIDMESPQAALVRLENTTQMLVARQNPRKLGEVKANIEAEIREFPDQVEAWIYIRPVGKQFISESNRWVQTFARDLSIRAAESVAAHWPNHASAVTFEESDDSAILTGIYLDCETNRRVLRQRRVSKHRTLKVGSTEKMAEDKFDNRLNAEASKLYRELMLRSLPQGLRLWVWDRARAAILAKKGPDGKPMSVEERLIGCIAWFKQEHGITEEHLSDVLGHTVGKDPENDLLYLKGITNIILEETMTVAQVFGIASRPARQRNEERTEPPSPDPTKVQNVPPVPAQPAEPGIEPENFSPGPVLTQTLFTTPDQHKILNNVLATTGLKKDEIDESYRLFYEWLGAQGIEKFGQIPATQFKDVLNKAEAIVQGIKAGKQSRKPKA